MYPMKMIPAFKDYLWGGTRLVESYGKQTALRPVAESWEISCHPDGESVVANGEFAGMTLGQVLERHPEYLGTRWSESEEFPILVKLIDAAQSLSVQVHPDDDYARRVENQQGKNEMWYVVEAQPGAELILGCKDGVSREDLRAGIENGILLELVNRIPVKAGDCFEIPAGMLHAIGAGVLVAEVQQNSNVTYRVFDYDRVGADGKKRPLHVARALDVVKPDLTADNRTARSSVVELEGYTVQKLTDWDYFQVERIDVASHARADCGPEGFVCVLVLEGYFQLQTTGEADMALSTGESSFLPAGSGVVCLVGQGRVLIIR